MRKFLFALCVALVSFCMNIYADPEPVDLDVEPIEQKGPGHRAPAQLPTLTYEDAYLYVYAPYYIESMTVNVKDMTGAVIYTYTAAMAAGQNTLLLSETVSEAKFSVELVFNGWRMVGYF